MKKRLRVLCAVVVLAATPPRSPRRPPTARSRVKFSKSSSRFQPRRPTAPRARRRRLPPGCRRRFSKRRRPLITSDGERRQCRRAPSGTESARSRRPADGAHRRRAGAARRLVGRPWTFLERDGWFYGRGTTDNKAGAAMLVANVITLKRAGWQPARDLIVVLTGDEETAQRGIQSLARQASRR